MARSTVEIQADIALTRRLIENHLDDLRRKVPDRWWMPVAMVAGAVAVGFLLSRMPFLKLVGTGARAVQTGVTVATTVGAVDRFLATQRMNRAA